MIKCNWCLKDTIKTSDKRYSEVICNKCLQKHHSYLKQIKKYNLDYREKELTMKLLRDNWHTDIPLKESIPSFNKYLINKLGIIDYIRFYIKERRKEIDENT